MHFKKCSVNFKICLANFKKRTSNAQWTSTNFGDCLTIIWEYLENFRAYLIHYSCIIQRSAENYYELQRIFNNSTNVKRTSKMFQPNAGIVQHTSWNFHREMFSENEWLLSAVQKIFNKLKGTFNNPMKCSANFNERHSNSKLLVNELRQPVFFDQFLRTWSNMCAASAGNAQQITKKFTMYFKECSASFGNCLANFKECSANFEEYSKDFRERNIDRYLGTVRPTSGNFHKLQ